MTWYAGSYAIQLAGFGEANNRTTLHVADLQRCTLLLKFTTMTLIACLIGIAIGILL